MQELLTKIKANSSPVLSAENLEIGKFLGKGSFGVVNQIALKQQFALKQISIKALLNNSKDEDELYDHLSSAYFEFEIMKKNINHVVRSYQCNYDEKEKMFSFTMDLMSGDLRSLIQDGNLPFKDYYKMFQNIVTGINLAQLNLFYSLSV